MLVSEVDVSVSNLIFVGDTHVNGLRLSLLVVGLLLMGLMIVTRVDFAGYIRAWYLPGLFPVRAKLKRDYIYYESEY